MIKFTFFAILISTSMSVHASQIPNDNSEQQIFMPDGENPTPPSSPCVSSTNPSFDVSSASFSPFNEQDVLKLIKSLNQISHNAPSQVAPSSSSDLVSSDYAQTTLLDSTKIGTNIEREQQKTSGPGEDTTQDMELLNLPEPRSFDQHHSDIDMMDIEMVQDGGTITPQEAFEINQ
ncbi:uncharacterized protein VICG_00382 [Vittaforma corneae ATCC 50505]|uniref:Uncharacterized protein n=1 Tax=Vittaforma corneae (strain ATCC 50505) TaxID=993615 RepID=L2GQ74_VITCO|nr:uncharacterized protein VICG_00382 [Vittaforma corneae ATCC 50505]ELA42630.1 hypothetical protein VICG_00382 [Vittaforma corneae ATCC 50505]